MLADDDLLDFSALNYAKEKKNEYIIINKIRLEAHAVLTLYT
jgi:hypothetical protein